MYIVKVNKDIFCRVAIFLGENPLLDIFSFILKGSITFVFFLNNASLPYKTFNYLPE